jgi:hypothetical protein
MQPGYCNMTNKNALLRITAGALEDLRLLFENTRGGVLPNGKIDAGFNCYAKAFVTVYLARLQGLPADHCAGRAFLVWAQPGRTIAGIIEPHAWAGLRSGASIDLSINRFEGANFLTTGHAPLSGEPVVLVRTTSNAQEFSAMQAELSQLPLGVHLRYHVKGSVRFRFDELRRAGKTINSPPTRAIAARYGRNDVVAKAVLHLHWVATGERDRLSAASQDDAREALARWDIDAMKTVRSLWLDVSRPQAWAAQSGHDHAFGSDAADAVNDALQQSEN